MNIIIDDADNLNVASLNNNSSNLRILNSIAMADLLNTSILLEYPNIFRDFYENAENQLKKGQSWCSNFRNFIELFKSYYPFVAVLI